MVRTVAFATLCICFCLLFAGPLAAQQPAASPPPAATAAPVAVPPSAASSALVGYYGATRQTAEAAQVVTLHLRGDGIVSLRSETVGGTPAVPVYETGTWVEKDGRASVHLDTKSSLVDRVPTDQTRESVDLTFSLTACALKLAADPGKAYGAEGLALAKQQCTP